jgi:hypothetical protein
MNKECKLMSDTYDEAIGGLILDLASLKAVSLTGCDYDQARALKLCIQAIKFKLDLIHEKYTREALKNEFKEEFQQVQCEESHH